MMNRELHEPLQLRPLVETLRRCWAIPGEMNFVRNFSNAVYFIADGATRFYLRVTSESQRSRRMIESELEFVLYLYDQGLPVARPIPSRAGRLVESHVDAGESYNACIFEEARGVEFGELKEPDLQELFQTSGKLLGLLHSASREFKPSSEFARFDWQEDRWHNFEKLVPESETAAWQQYVELRDWLKDLPSDENYFGLIHGDYNIANMRFSGCDITLFDFDACCRHWYAYDIALFLHYFGARNEDARKQAYESFLSGYSQTSPLDEAMINQIPLFGKMRLLFSYLVFAEEWGFEDLNENQEKYFELRRRLFAQPPTWPYSH